MSSDIEQLGNYEIIRIQLGRIIQRDNEKLYTIDAGRFKYVIRRLDNTNYDNIKQNGGEGSGHWGHSGRPGKVGGSAKSNQTLTLDEQGLEEFKRQYIEFKRKNKDSDDNLLEEFANNQKYKSLHSKIDKLVDEDEDGNISEIKDLQNQEQIDNMIFDYFEQPTLTERDKEVIKIYSNKSLCSKINGYLRDNNSIKDKKKVKKIKNDITDLAKTIDKSILKQDIRVYRGDLLTKERLEDFKKHFKDKTPMLNHSFTSTSFYKQSAEEFIRQKKESEYAYFFNINVKKGKGIGMYLDSESIKPSEIEFLIQKETYFMIDDIDEKNKVINMTVVVRKNI